MKLGEGLQYAKVESPINKTSHLNFKDNEEAKVGSTSGKIFTTDFQIKSNVKGLIVKILYGVTVLD